MTSHKHRILVVDDHPLVREWLVLLINREADLTVCGEAGDADQTLQAVAELKPDMVILDLSMKGTHGTDLIKEIRGLVPDLRVLVLSTYDESLYAERVLRAGAMGYVTKQEAADTVREAIRRVLSGQIYLSEKLAAQCLHKFVGAGAAAAGSVADLLSDRELEIFQLIGRGYRLGRIAEELRLSVKTVEGYVARLKAKLGIKDAQELLRYAIEFNRSASG